MNAVLKVLSRCLVVEFYKQNAAFFGLLFLVLFGFIKAGEHIAIGSFLVANPSTLFFLYLLWVAHAMKVVLFVLPALNKEENQFLEAFYLLQLKNKISAIGLSTILLLLPLIAYATFLIALAIPYAFYWSILSLFLSLMIFGFVVSFLLYKKLNSLPHEKKIVHIGFLNKIAKPSYLFFFEHLIRNDFVLLLLSKIYTCLMIIGTSALYRTDQFDIRLITTGILLALVGNVALLHKYIWFYFHKMNFAKNLPLSISKISTSHFITFIVLIIPEIIVIVRHYPLAPTFIDVLGVVAFGFSIVTLIYGLLIRKQVELSEFVIQIFWLIVLTTFLILFSIHPLILAFLYFFISVTIMYFRLYKFEYVEKAH